MANIMVRVDEGTKALWVDAAHEERVSLSEWIRRRCDDGLGERVVGVVQVVPAASASGSRPFPLSVKEFRGPDPKGGKK